MSSSTENTAATAAAEAANTAPATGQTSTESTPVTSEPAPAPVAAPAPHHHILAGIATTLEGFGRLIEKEFEDLAAEIKNLAAKIRAKL